MSFKQFHPKYIYYFSQQFFFNYGKANFLSNFGYLLLMFWIVFGNFSSNSMDMFQCVWLPSAQKKCRLS